MAGRNQHTWNSRWQGPAGKFKAGNPGGGRPLGAKNHMTMQYLEAIQGVVTPEEMAKVAKKALEDTQHEDYLCRDRARTWLAKVLLPVDPATFIQLFAPTISINDIKAQLAEMRELRDELNDFVNAKKALLEAAPAATEAEFRDTDDVDHVAPPEAS